MYAATDVNNRTLLSCIGQLFSSSRCTLTVTLFMKRAKIAQCNVPLYNLLQLKKVSPQIQRYYIPASLQKAHHSGVLLITCSCLQIQAHKVLLFLHQTLDYLEIQLCICIPLLVGSDFFLTFMVYNILYNGKNSFFFSKMMVIMHWMGYTDKYVRCD